MATLEHEQLRDARARPHERHVFVSHDGRRQRLLRGAGLVAAVFALAWLAALALALVGDTSLPALRLPATRHDAPARATSAPPRHSTAIHQAASTPRPLQPERATAPASAARPAAPAPRPATHPAPAASVAPVAPTQTAVTPQRGWGRRGWTAPPGQARRSQPRPRGSGQSHSPGASPANATHGNGHGRA